MHATDTLDRTVRHDNVSFLKAVHAAIGTWVGAAVERASERLPGGEQSYAGAPGREQGALMLDVLRNHRGELVLHIAQAIAAQLDMPSGDVGLPDDSTDADSSLKLSLIDEVQIDEEIEVARIVRLIESEADAELQELNVLYSSFRGLGRVDAQALPLRPQVCAQGLRAGLAQMPMQHSTRLWLLRAMGSALSVQMRHVYQAQSRLLSGWGVKSVGYGAWQTAVLVASPYEVKADSKAPEAPAAAQSMERLVEWARSTAKVALEHPDESTEDLMLRLMSNLEPAGQRVPALAPAAAQQLMQRLFGQLSAQGAASPAAADLMEDLQRTGRRLVEQEPELWSNHNHPWWTLIDRLLTVCAVHHDLGTQGQRALYASLSRAVSRIQQSPKIDPHACQTAADDVQAVADQLLQSEARELQEQVSDLQRQAEQEETENELRNQLVQQLRATPVSPSLRQFLVGPWAHVMAAQALHHGADSGELATAALVVDDLIRATANPGKRVSSAHRAVLLRQIAEGLHLAGVPADRVQAELTDIKALLRDPPEIPDSFEAWQETVDTLPAGHVLDLHAGLPTVPLAMGDDPPAAATSDWLTDLNPGAYCRLFLQGQWMTAQLSWVSPTRRLFVFNSRHGGRSHSLTQRMLQKLRNAGLATRIEDGFLLAQAMDSLMSTDLQ